MLTSQQLIKKMFSGGSIDRVGIFEGFWTETLDKWVTQGYPTRTVEVGGQIEFQPEDPCLFFHFDMHKTGGFFDTEPQIGVAEVIEETEEWEVIRNGAGAALKWWKHKSGTPEHIDFAINSREVWEREYRPHLLALNVDRYNCKWWRGDNTLEDDKADLVVARERSQWAFYGHVFVWEVMRSTLGDLSLYQNLILDPDWIHDVCRVYTDFFKLHFDHLIAQNGPPDGIWLFEDIAYKNGLFASPKMFAELIFPYYAEMVQVFNGYGLPVIFHSDGNMDQGIPLVIEAGFQGLNPMEAKAGCDLFAYADRYRDELVFIGGLDVRVLETNDHDLIRTKVADLVEGMKARNARYLFGSDHTVTPNVDYDSYRVALDTYRQHMMY